jgi:hypothetical protein
LASLIRSLEPKRMPLMANPEPANDPLAEHDSLTSELANLEKQFAGRKIKQEDFEVLSKQLKERILKAESQSYGMARKDESMAKKLRLRNYNDPAVQQVIGYYLRSGGGTLEPEFGADRIPRYPVDTDAGDKTMIGQQLLQRLADIGLVTESLFERIVSCPDCGTPSNVYLRFKCTQCGSIDISINRMIEHLQCGTIHQEDVFRVGKNLICPTCKKLLQSAGEYRVIGVVCSCKNCHAHFEDPAESFFCRQCKKDFPLPKAIIVDVNAYSMTKTALAEARRFMGVNTLAKVLTENGLQVKTPGIISGPTKEIVFSLIAQKDARTIAIDISQADTEVEVEPVLELYVKTLEATPAAAVFGAIPSLSKRARDVAALHNIQAAEGKTPNEMARKVLEIVQKV